MLNEIRLGICSEKSLQMLEKRKLIGEPQYESGIMPTVLYLFTTLTVDINDIQRMFKWTA